MIKLIGRFLIITAIVVVIFCYYYYYVVVVVFCNLSQVSTVYTGHIHGYACTKNSIIIIISSKNKNCFHTSIMISL